MNSNFIAEMPSHGENRGSSPLGSANDFNQLFCLMDLWSKIGPISCRI